jgi:glycosyltransferase involved in cell wall biosynthesis
MPRPDGDWKPGIGNLAVSAGRQIPRGETVYFKKQLEPHIDGRAVQLVGEVDEAKKQPFLAEAAALLFPIDWPEPFGLVMIEAMACGTPVIAYRCGSVPEVVEDGVTGFIVENEEQAVRAVGDLGQLDRRKVRARFEERFSADRMAREYESAYRELISAAAGHSAAERGAKAERRLETKLTDEPPVSS